VRRHDLRSWLGEGLPAAERFLDPPQQGGLYGTRSCRTDGETLAPAGQLIVEDGWSQARAAAFFNVSWRTAATWAQRDYDEGAAGRRLAAAGVPSRHRSIPALTDQCELTITQPGIVRMLRSAIGSGRQGTTSCCAIIHLSARPGADLGGAMAGDRDPAVVCKRASAGRSSPSCGALRMDGCSSCASAA
jgi:hypothetical protein